MEKFKSGFESLRKYECPEWYANAKFGIWSHWGPQSVPMYGDWYARKMYIEDSDAYLYHIRHYGHPSKFGYKDLCKLWKAENFCPEDLMKLYVEAGAKYFVAQATHHDNFFNFDSEVNRFNSVKVGPGKDICGMWKAAADKCGIPFGVTEHLSASYCWFAPNKGADSYGKYAGVPYDGNDPDYRDFYYDNADSYIKGAGPYELKQWYTHNKAFRNYWYLAMSEVIEKYQPDLLYSDGPLPFGNYGDNKPGDDDFQLGLDIVAKLYNASIEKYGENRAVYNQKDRRPEVYEIGILDIEKSQLEDIQPRVWQTDTCIGSWFYDVRETYKKPGHIIEMLVDIISKNGTMLLNILQKPDGSIDDQALYILEELKSWFKVCADGVYDTRPFRVFGEGDSRVIIDKFREDAVAWNSSDFRFTKKGNTLYAFMMRAPENRVAVVKSLLESEKVETVRLLGGGSLPFQQAFGTLTVKLPCKLPTKYTNCLAIQLK